ncbi:hypothetical protein BJ875DRAFT_541535 [Amylocarpus encephaloides]|uniref:Rhodopsin domain-containing protein n=1 Tax=Amylocarpus encephaloides TaxID=45428 RepID=A0A9P7YND6_9HELO|nr:hypothetical protein BJ875DRAFT_541535 [Amylocarpus encephaloides]
MSFSVGVRDRPTISDSNTSPLIQILSWLFLSLIIISVAAQFITKRAISRRFGPSDGLLLVALLLAIGQISTLLSPAGREIGNSSIELPVEKANGALKALYSGDMLIILTLTVVKGSVLVALYAITPIMSHRIVIYATTAVTLGWGISGIFATAFQCPSPHRWNLADQQCIDIRALKTYSASMNILTDVALIIIPTIVILPTQMAWEKRLTVLGGFWFRLLAIVATAIQIIFIRRLVVDEHILNTVWQTVVCQEIVLATSIITACIPFLKPFLMSLESGFLRADDENRRTAAGLYGSGAKSSRRTKSYIKMKSQKSREESIKVQETDV